MYRTIELKPCPFCGGNAVPVYCEHGSRYTSTVIYPLKRGTVKCKKCEVCLPEVYNTVTLASEAWNRRAGDKK